MGMTAAGASGSGRGGRGHRRRGRHHALMSEINVTPMVDVMLVLLIIFMVAAPLLTVGVPIDLPETKAKAMNADTQPIQISIGPSGEIHLQETEIPQEELVAKLQAISKTGYDERIYSLVLERAAEITDCLRWCSLERRCFRCGLREDFRIDIDQITDCGIRAASKVLRVYHPAPVQAHNRHDHFLRGRSFQREQWPGSS